MMETERKPAELVLARARELFSSAKGSGQDLACLLISIDRLRRYDEPVRELLRTAVEGLVLSEPEGGSWRVLRQESELLVLCPELPLAEAGDTARALVDGARRLRVRCGERQLRPRVSIGVAHNRNRPELDFEILLGVARESLGVAQAAGGDRWVHTELYDLLTRRRRSAEVAEEAAQAFDFEELAAGFEPLAIPTPPPAPAAAEVATPEAQATALEVVDAFEEALGSTTSVKVLERRIIKLLRALELAESEIQRLQHEFGTEAGIASIYRTVQGLSPDEPLVEKKRRLMRELFRANRALRKAAS